MPNTLTGLIPDLYDALDVVSRELVGMIPSVTIEPRLERAAVGQTVRSFVAPPAAATNITPAVTPPNDGDQTIGNRTITITKSRRVPFRWAGEEEVGVDHGPGRPNIMRAQIAQAMRTLCNEIEADLTALHVQASRAVGTAGTTPFGATGDYMDAARVRQVLADNGAPLTGISLVLNTAAGANLRGRQVTAAARDDDLVRRGVLLDVHGMAIRESAQVRTHAAGNAIGSTTNTAGYAVGATTITLASVGTGAILAGDVIAFAGDPHRYVVVSGDSDVSNGGTITIAAPGLRQAIPAAATAITVVASSVRNMCFSRDAIVLAQRMPALPDGRDMADDRTTVTDPVSGLSFEVSEYRQYRQVQYEVACSWGVAMIKPEHCALLLG